MNCCAMSAELRSLGGPGITVSATFAFIRAGVFKDTLAAAGQLLDHDHDLIHKAVGWMLREVGNRDRAIPRTMLRDAIETFPEDRRRAYPEDRI